MHWHRNEGVLGAGAPLELSNKYAANTEYTVAWFTMVPDLFIDIYKCWDYSSSPTVSITIDSIYIWCHYNNIISIVGFGFNHVITF